MPLLRASTCGQPIQVGMQIDPPEISFCVDLDYGSDPISIFYLWRCFRKARTQLGWIHILLSFTIKPRGQIPYIEVAFNLNQPGRTWKVLPLSLRPEHFSETILWKYVNQNLANSPTHILLLRSSKNTRPVSKVTTPFYLVWHFLTRGYQQTHMSTYLVWRFLTKGYQQHHMST